VPAVVLATDVILGRIVEVVASKQRREAAESKQRQRVRGGCTSLLGSPSRKLGCGGCDSAAKASKGIMTGLLPSGTCWYVSDVASVSLHRHAGSYGSALDWECRTQYWHM
jgi:hypothetical protein